MVKQAAPPKKGGPKRLPFSSTSREVRFLEPFSKLRETRLAVLSCRHQRKLRYWLADEDMEEICAVVSRDDDLLLDDNLVTIHRIVASRVNAIWEILETTWSVPFEKQVRCTITQIANRYFTDAEFEAKAPFVEDAREILNALHEAATKFSITIDQLTHGGWKADGRWKGQSAKYAGWYASDLLAEQLAAGRLRDLVCREPGPPDLTDWILSESELLSEIQTACRLVQDKLDADVDHDIIIQPGQAWSRMICELDALAEQHQLPNGISNDENKPDSAFVKFVGKLQEFFPSDYRRYIHSLNGLAKAMSRARSDRGTKGEERSD